MMEERTWDGTAPGLSVRYPEEDIHHWQMTQSEDGTVYYVTREPNPQKMVWCAGSELSRHMARLKQLGVIH